MYRLKIVIMLIYRSNAIDFEIHVDSASQKARIVVIVLGPACLKVMGEGGSQFVESNCLNREVILTFGRDLIVHPSR